MMTRVTHFTASQNRGCSALGSRARDTSPHIHQLKEIEQRGSGTGAVRACIAIKTTNLCLAQWLFLQVLCLGPCPLLHINSTVASGQMMLRWKGCFGWVCHA